jgi:hypothetical protein
MSENSTKTAKSKKSSVFWVFIVLFIIGLVTFIYEVTRPVHHRTGDVYL